MGFKSRQRVDGADNGLSPGSGSLDRRESEDKKMSPFEKCPLCGGELEAKKVEKLLRGGGHTASIKVAADVCRHCGERLYSEDIARAFEAIRAKLEKQEFEHLKPVGQTFTVDKDWLDKSIQPAVYAE